MFKNPSYLLKILFIQLLVYTNVFGQDKNLQDKLFADYEQFKEQSITNRRIKHNQIQPLIDHLRTEKKFDITRLGESIEGRQISMISMGSGNVDVLLWSQMHGNEPTATMAIFDILNFLKDPDYLTKEKKELLRKLRIHFIPMLNPDGAERYTRRTALNIDLNRDALRLQDPEGQILKRVRDSLDADFGFNLHDQSIYYNVERTPKPATISYLATAYDYEKSVNEVRKRSMQVISLMNNIIQQYALGQVGRYSDDFEPRAFGDNIQKWGTSLILIESGGYQNDLEKQYIRKLNYISILSALFSIADNSYASVDPSEYETIPFNDRKLFDLKIENLEYPLNGKNYRLDVGINWNEVDNEAHTSFYNSASIEDLGDLSTYYGYETLDATGLTYAPGKVYEKEMSYNDLAKTDFKALLDEGYTTIVVDSFPEGVTYSSYPVNLIKNGQDEGQPTELRLGGNSATFLLMDQGKIKYVIVNGFPYVPGNRTEPIRNGILKK